MACSSTINQTINYKVYTRSTSPISKVKRTYTRFITVEEEISVPRVNSIIQGSPFSCDARIRSGSGAGFSLSGTGDIITETREAEELKLEDAFDVYFDGMHLISETETCRCNPSSCCPGPNGTLALPPEIVDEETYRFEECVNNYIGTYNSNGPIWTGPSKFYYNGIEFSSIAEFRSYRENSLKQNLFRAFRNPSNLNISCNWLCNRIYGPDFCRTNAQNAFFQFIQNNATININLGSPSSWVPSEGINGSEPFNADISNCNINETKYVDYTATATEQQMQDCTGSTNFGSAIGITNFFIK